MNHSHRNVRPAQPYRTASLAEIEAEISMVLEVAANVQSDIREDWQNPVWQIAEAVRGLAWAVESLVEHHSNAAAGGTARTTVEVASALERIAREGPR